MVTGTGWELSAARRGGRDNLAGSESQQKERIELAAQVRSCSGSYLGKVPREWVKIPTKWSAPQIPSRRKSLGSGSASGVPRPMGEIA